MKEDAFYYFMLVVKIHLQKKVYRALRDGLILLASCVYFPLYQFNIKRRSLFLKDLLNLIPEDIYLEEQVSVIHYITFGI